MSIDLLHYVEHFDGKMLREKERLDTTKANLPLHGAHVGAPKLNPMAFEPHTTHSCFGHQV